MPPSEAAYNTDWVWSSNSNVHVANDRAWFTDFTPFKTRATHFSMSSPHLEVIGVGTVRLDLRTNADDPAEHNTITLSNVLLAPKSHCNIFATQATHGYFLDWSSEGGILRDAETKGVVGLLQLIELWSLWLLDKPEGHTSLERKAGYCIDAIWPAKERLKYEAHEYALKSDVDEDAWVEKHWGG